MQIFTADAEAESVSHDDSLPHSHRGASYFAARRRAENNLRRDIYNICTPMIKLFALNSANVGAAPEQGREIFSGNEQKLIRTWSQRMEKVYLEPPKLLLMDLVSGHTFTITSHHKIVDLSQAAVGS